MEQLITSCFKAIASIVAPGMFGVFFLSLFATLGALILFVIAVTTGAGMLAPLVTDPLTAAWLPVMSGFGAAFLALFLFPGIMPIIVNFFDARIAHLIERESYPAAQPIEPPFWPEFMHDLRFSLTAIVLNILFLPLYLFPIVGQVGFYVLNGYLLGREFFIMVARRHIPLDDAKNLRRQHARVIFLGGLLLMVFATIPILNLIAPFWGIAVMTHLYHTLVRTPKMDILPPKY